MSEVKPLYFSPDGQILQMQPGDTPSIVIVPNEYATLMQQTAPGICCAIIENTAIPINSVNLPSINYRTKPFIDCIILEGGNTGDRVRAALTHGKIYQVPYDISYTNNDILYLGRDSKLTTIQPSLSDGDNWLVIVGRIINSNNFIFDPQDPINLTASPHNGELPPLIPNTWLFTDGIVVMWRELRASDISPVLQIQTFTTTPSILEIGQILINPVFNFTTNKVSSASLRDSLNNVNINHITSPFTYTATFTRNTVGSYNFTLTAITSGEATTQSLSIGWLIKRYFGSQTKYDGSSNLETFIKTLSSDLSSNRNKTFTANANVGQNLYYVIPISFGTPVFFVGGFQGGFTFIGNIDITNTYGVVVNYQVWESDNSNLGNTTVSIQ